MYVKQRQVQMLKCRADGYTELGWNIKHVTIFDIARVLTVMRNVVQGRH